MSLEDFHHQVAAQWLDAIRTVNAAEDETATWSGVGQIISALTPFMGERFNHALLPRGGGMDILSAEHSTEPGCIELRTSPRSAYVVKPATLTLEYFPDHPAESFLLLELSRLIPSGIYETDEFAGRLRREELVELSPGEYAAREVWDRGYVDIGEDGREVPLPDNARLVVRWFGGKFMFVAKGSIWNGIPATYDGRHNSMEADDIRDAIQRLIDRRDS